METILTPLSLRCFLRRCLRKNRLVFYALAFAVLQGGLSVLRPERLDEKGEGVVATFFANGKNGVVGVAQQFGGIFYAQAV